MQRVVTSLHTKMCRSEPTTLTPITAPWYILDHSGLGLRATVEFKEYVTVLPALDELCSCQLDFEREKEKLKRE